MKKTGRAPKKVDEPRTEEEWYRLLEIRIEESGLTQNQFCESVLRRGNRNVRRWIARENPISQDVKDFLLHPKPAPWP